MKQNDTFKNNNNRGNKSKTIRRGYFMKYFLNFLFVINGIFGSVSPSSILFVWFLWFSRPIMSGSLTMH